MSDGQQEDTLDSILADITQKNNVRKAMLISLRRQVRILAGRVRNRANALTEETKREVIEILERKMEAYQNETRNLSVLMNYLDRIMSRLPDVVTSRVESVKEEMRYHQHEMRAQLRLTAALRRELR